MDRTTKEARIRQAMMEHRGINLVHIKDDGEETRRAVLPYWLARDRRGRMYVQGFCALRQARRSFRLDRVRSVEIRDKELSPDQYEEIGRPLGLLQSPTGVILSRVEGLQHG
jgi:predicted DNA-binding transcriptional regulator YafY